MKSLEGKRDTSGTKCLRALNYIAKHLKEFGLVSTGFRYDHKKRKAIGYILTERIKLPDFYEHKGPPANIKAAEHFKQKNPNDYEKEGVLYAKKPYEYTSAIKLVKDLLNHEQVQKRTEKHIKTDDFNY